MTFRRLSKQRLMSVSVQNDCEVWVFLSLLAHTFQTPPIALELMLVIGTIQLCG